MPTLPHIENLTEGQRYVVEQDCGQYVAPVTGVFIEIATIQISGIARLGIMLRIPSQSMGWGRFFVPWRSIHSIKGAV